MFLYKNLHITVYVLGLNVILEFGADKSWFSAHAYRNLVIRGMSVYFHGRNQYS